MATSQSAPDLGDLINDIASAANDMQSSAIHLEEIVETLKDRQGPIADLTPGQDTLPDHEQRLDAAVAAIAGLPLGRWTGRDKVEAICRAYVGFRP